MLCRIPADQELKSGLLVQVQDPYVPREHKESLVESGTNVMVTVEVGPLTGPMEGERQIRHADRA